MKRVSAIIAMCLASSPAWAEAGCRPPMEVWSMYGDGIISANALMGKCLEGETQACSAARMKVHQKAYRMSCFRQVADLTPLTGAEAIAKNITIEFFNRAAAMRHVRLLHARPSPDQG